VEEDGDANELVTQGNRNDPLAMVSPAKALNCAATHLDAEA
jgi:hypothetical protein